MQYLSVLLALLSTAAAVDIRAHYGTSCSSGSTACIGANPDTCCRFPEDGNLYGAVSLVAIPRQWSLHFSAATETDCFSGVTSSTGTDGSGRDICITGGRRWKSARYKFVSKKRDEEKPCTSWQEPNLIILEDGTQYELGGMDKSLVAELGLLAANGVTEEDIPEKFSEFRKST